MRVRGDLLARDHQLVLLVVAVVQDGQRAEDGEAAGDAVGGLELELPVLHPLVLVVAGEDLALLEVHARGEAVARAVAHGAPLVHEAIGEVETERALVAHAPLALGDEGTARGVARQGGRRIGKNDGGDERRRQESPNHRSPSFPGPKAL
jgi:hypothetical protein